MGENREGEMWNVARNIGRLDSKRIDVLEQAIQEAPRDDGLANIEERKKERLSSLVDEAYKRLDQTEQSELWRALSEFRFFDLLAAPATPTNAIQEPPR